MFKKQFFGSVTWKTPLVIALAHIMAFFVREQPIEGIVLIAVFFLVFWLTRRSLLNGILIAFAEVFVGGHGHLLDVEIFGFSLSLRMVIFIAVMSAWLWGWWCHKYVLQRDPWRELPFVILIIALVSGFVQGIFTNGAGVAFDDVNGYVTLGYFLPLFCIHWTSQKKRELLQMLAGAMIWIIAFSLSLLFLFTHIDGDTLHILYTFIRDARLAEVTLQVVDNKGSFLEVLATRYGFLKDADYFYRVFMPSQSTAILALLISWSTMLFAYRRERLPDVVGWIAILSLSVLFMSLSRSFLLGTFVAMACVWGMALITESKRWVTIRRSFWMIACALVAFLLLYALVMLPFPTRPDLTNAAFFQTSSTTGRSEAVISRWTLLDSLTEEISDSPLVGKGFGASVTYDSSDPRIIEQTGGVYTTYRFEWGWHDMWLKMGLLGLIAFLVYFSIVFLSGRDHIRKQSQHWLIYALLASILALFVTHTFSPYLNHPIGIVWMLFVLPFIDTRRWGKQIEDRIYQQEIFDSSQRAVVTSRLAKIHSREN